MYKVVGRRPRRHATTLRLCFQIRADESLDVQSSIFASALAHYCRAYFARAEIMASTLALEGPQTAQTGSAMARMGWHGEN